MRSETVSTTTMTFSADVLRLDAAAEAAKIEAAIRDAVFHRLRRKGLVVGLSGGIDSSVVGALAARALGPDRVLGLLMPEKDSVSESQTLGQSLADTFRIPTIVENISGILQGAECYRRRDDAIRRVVPEYGPNHRSKIVLPDLISRDSYAVYSVVVETPDGARQRVRLTPEAYLGIVAATNFKQRVRKMMEYYHADNRHYAVAGTPNLLEYDQGFFVKNGDGAADVKPIAHLYKSQVFQLAAYLGVPEAIQRRQPTTDTYSLEQSQEEFYFGLSLEKTDLCLYAKNHDLAPDAIAEALQMTPDQVRRAYAMLDSKREVARYLKMAPILVGEPA